MRALIILLAMTPLAAAGSPVTLERAQRLALARYPVALNLDERVIQAEALTRRAWAILLPNVSANASLTRNSQEVAIDPSLLGGPAGADRIVISELWGKRFGFSANMTLLKASAFPLLKNAYTNLEQTQERGRFDKNELLFTVARTFYQVHTTKELVRAAEEDLKIAKQLKREAELRKQVGQTTRIDLLRSQLQVTTAERALHNAREAVKLAKYALATLTGLRGDIDIAPPPRPETPGGALTDLEDEALRARRDLRALELDVAIAERDKLSTWLKWVPDVDVTYSWSWDSAGGFSGQNDTWQLIFGGRWSLLEGGGRFAELAERRSRVRVNKNNLRQRRLEIREEVRAAYLELARVRRDLVLAERQLALARETHDAVHQQYGQGLATSLDLQTAFSELQEGRVGHVVAQLNRDLALLGLQRAAGRLDPSVR